MPTVEFGAGISHGWQDDERQTLIGPSLKVALRPVSKGVGLGVGLSAAVDPSTGKADSAWVLIPATVDLTKHVRTNLNLGYVWSRDGDRHALLAGVQFEARVRDKLSLMAEGFVRDGHPPGFQTGIRWTPRQWIDVDLLGGHRIDDSSTSTITVGLTLRH